ncbi:MAG: hypothetical protein LBV68_07710 [Spirochaetaceae bacterium]|jgi:TolB-like protein|nr:hypothetical protein [Spirochaetaceae bacterium]
MKGILGALAVFAIILCGVWNCTGPEYPQRPTRETHTVTETPPPKIVRRQFPKEAPFAFPAEYKETYNKMSNVFLEVSNSFTGNNVPVLAVVPFTMSSGDNSAVLLTYAGETAYSYLSGSSKIRAVKRDYSAKSRITSKYILIGKVIPIGNQVRLTVRVEDVRTGEIIDAFDEYIDKSQISMYF